MKPDVETTRRTVLKATLGLGALALAPRAAAAAESALTPQQTEGPFYPVYHRLDEDNDLTFVATRDAPASGAPVYVGGRVLDAAGTPVRGALVEIWQACASGRYDHPDDTNPAPLDPNFQYWGRAISDADGQYLFKTLVPGAYPADTDWIRPPHIHFKATRWGFVPLTTQMYFAGNRHNAADRILQKLAPAEQALVVVTPMDAYFEGEGQRPLYGFDLTLERLQPSGRRSQDHGATQTLSPATKGPGRG